MKHRCWILENLIKGLLRAMQDHGLQKNRTESLKDDICNAAHALFKAIPVSSWYSPVMTNYSTSLAICLVTEIGAGLQVGVCNCLSLAMNKYYHLYNNIVLINRVSIVCRDMDGFDLLSVFRVPSDACHG